MSFDNHSQWLHESLRRVRRKVMSAQILSDLEAGTSSFDSDGVGMLMS